MSRGRGDSGPRLAVIGGTGMNDWPGFDADRDASPHTLWGEAAAPPRLGRFEGQPVTFLARHGVGHRLPPHRINYRANIQALAAAGARRIIAIAAVGAMRRDLPPGSIALPEDCIDYTWGREHSYSDGPQQPLRHVEFTEPFAPLRGHLQAAAQAAAVPVVDGGVLGVTQGPRLESAAEVRRLLQDGCDMVGMTTMPEAALARELDLEYAVIAVCVNWAAGMGSGDIHGEIEASLAQGMATVRRLLSAALHRLSRDD